MHSNSSITLNTPPHILTEEITLRWLKVDPFTNGFFQKESSFSLCPSLHRGIHFVIWGKFIPYDTKHMSAIDGTFGRMLRVSDEAETVQVIIVEHLLSALQLLWLSNVEIHLDAGCYAEFLSGKACGIGFRKPTYIVPICWPWVSGFIEQIEWYCIPSWVPKEDVKIEEKKTFFLQEDPCWKYRWIVRELTIEPAERLEIEVLSAQQPDIHNNPEAWPFRISEW